MQVVTVSYILLAPRPEGFGIDHTLSFVIATISCVATLGCFGYYLRSLRPSMIKEKI